MKTKSGGGKSLWHYTTAERSKLILMECLIVPATAGVPDGEKPAVWFSSNQVWEKTATKGILDESGARRDCTWEEMTELGIVRFGVHPETAPLNWTQYRYQSGITPVNAKWLAQSAKLCGANPNEWRATFEPVPWNEWTALEQWSNGAWVGIALPDQD